jgi:seryl-tRNA synthetase
VLDPRLLRRDPDGVRAALRRRGPGAAEVLDRWLELDRRRRDVVPELEALRAEQNQASGAIAQAKRAGEDASAAIEAMREVAGRAKALQDELHGIEEQLQAAARSLPNLPDPTAPDADEVVRHVGERRAIEQPRDHLELAGERIDTERGARVAGSRFAYLRGELAMLELHLVRFAMDRVVAHGFEPVVPPVLVREEALFGTGFLPDTEQQLYRLADDPLFLVGTSEVALASLHAGEVLEEEELPRRYAGFSSCFRREAGAAGRDTRGIIRVHQFEKVEMFSFVRPEDSGAEHERLLAIEEELLQALELPYRVVNIAVDDLGASAAKKWDCEAWLPSQGTYRELTSTSNTTDFQARRLEVRVRRGGRRPEVAHTLNGTAIAVQRWLVALLENGQQPDGSIALPAALQAVGAPRELAAVGR